ncbi:MAG: hypothetical protein KBF89_02355 [Acidimicrobiia bacterium]|nr:hypothetical protein [Acidimicrobiia bacterium]
MYALIQPDILKIEKLYWYSINEIDNISVGSIVRIILNGRKVRGWVIKKSEIIPDDIEITKLKPVIEFVSRGPNEKMLSFSIELSKYYLVSPVVFLRMCSPDVIVKDTQFQKSSYRSFTRPSCDAKSPQVIYVNPRENRRKLILENIASIGSTIIITPDSRMKIAKFLRETGHKVIVINIDGKVSREVYLQMGQGNCVVIASRKAIFANVDDLNSIIILDDGFEQLRDERSPRFHSVDVAKLRAAKENCNLTVITSVPTVVVRDFNISDKRSAEGLWPKIQIENLLKTDPTLGIFTHKVVNAIKKVVELGGNVALISNNTTIARKLICKKCENIIVCEHCSHNVILSGDDQLTCEICKKIRPKICSNCGGIELKKYRKGNKSLKGELDKLFPKTNILEIEKNTEVPEELISGKIPNILIGTESIFHIGSVTKNILLFVFLDFDSYLLRPRSDAFEQSLISITRALRLLKQTQLEISMLLITKMPDHQIIKDLQAGDFVSNLNRDLELKMQLGTAPINATVQIKVKNDDLSNLIETFPTEILDGYYEDGEYSYISLTAENHQELTLKSYDLIRNFSTNHRVSLAVDSYE